MPHPQAEPLFRRPAPAYPRLIVAATLLILAYVLVVYFTYSHWAIACCAAGLAVAYTGITLIRDPAARLTGRLLVLTNAGAFKFSHHTHSLANSHRIMLETRRCRAPNNRRGDGLLVNLAGVPKTRIAIFIALIRELGIEISN